MSVLAIVAILALQARSATPSYTTTQQIGPSEFNQSIYGADQNQLATFITTKQVVSGYVCTNSERPVRVGHATPWCGHEPALWFQVLEAVLVFGILSAMIVIAAVRFSKHYSANKSDKKTTKVKEAL